MIPRVIGSRVNFGEREFVENVLFQVYFVIMTIVLLVPLLIVIATSLSASRLVVFPPDGISLRWYSAFFQDSSWMNAVWNSIVIAVGASVLSTVIGVSAALGIRGLPTEKSVPLIVITQLPLLLPPVVLAITLIPFLSMVGVYQTYWGVIIAHSLWGIPMVFFIMIGVLRRFDWTVYEAAMDLGASKPQAFFEIVLPGIKTGVLAGALVAFIVSLQEFVMALFLTGTNTRTLPVQTWTSLRQTLEPTVSVASTVLIASLFGMLLLLAAVFGIERIARTMG